MPYTSLLIVCLLGLAACEAAAEHFTTLVAPVTQRYPRNTEGSIVELEDGTLLLAWSRFTGGTSDHSTGEIAGVRSKDGGTTWGRPFVIQPNTGRQNVMSASLLRLRSGAIALYYLIKNSNSDLHLWQRISKDDGKSWGPPHRCTMTDGYNIVNNDRVVQLASGRLIAPVSYTPDIGKPTPLIVFVVFSDDGGRTWVRSSPDLEAPLRGAMEPGVVELANGRLLMIIRTSTGYIYRSWSDDKGATWSKAEQTDIVSPESPATLKVLPNGRDLLLVWNNNPEAVKNYRARRNPMTIAVSRDNGMTWENIRNIEDSPTNSYAYTSIVYVKDSAILTYYDTEQWSKGLALRLRSIPLDEITRPKP